ncbi:MAG: hypothetical protein AB1461_04640 [Thermodesulfobacteriota bacterium]
MPIKRLTIELDDSVDQISPTQVPGSLTLSRTEKTKEDTTPSTLPTHYAEESGTEPINTYRSKQTGRTFPDLITEFMDTPRAMSTILMFVPFIIFVPKIDSIASFKYPVITGAILNLMWFVGPWLCSGIPRLFKKK